MSNSSLYFLLFQISSSGLKLVGFSFTNICTNILGIVKKMISYNYLMELSTIETARIKKFFLLPTKIVIWKKKIFQINIGV